MADDDPVFDRPSIEVIDIERRVEESALELLREYEALKQATGNVPARIRVRMDTEAAADYPCATVNAVGYGEFGERTGWYKGALQLGAMTYRPDDKDAKGVKAILGALRGWSQRKDLAAALNATVAAGTQETEIEFRHIKLDGETFDFSEGRLREWIVPLEVLCRPSRGNTTAI